MRLLAADAVLPAELMFYLWNHKRWWLIPLVASLILLGLHLVFAISSSVGPFIYTLF
jgi:hypothetical protein